jgi:hemolysin activation/secretion protein
LIVLMASSRSSFAEQTYHVARYEIRGGSAIEPMASMACFQGASGSNVPLSRICQGLAALRKAYIEKGCDNVIVSVAEQQIAEGVVVVEVRNGDAVARPKAATFEVRGFDISGNTLLPQIDIDRILAPAIGLSKTVEDVRKQAKNLELEYRARGYPTVAVALPSQRLTNGIVKLTVTEGRLSAVSVIGNRWFSSNNVMRALPGARTNVILNSRAFQNELDAANSNPDRQIYPTLGPGPDSGSSALALRIKDRIPLHGHLEADNYNTPGTPNLRLNASAQYNNLWQREHQFGLSYSFTPQSMKTIGNKPNFAFNQPLISSYSAFYRMPLTIASQDTPDIMREYGHQEASRQFLLPEARSGSELICYASASSSDTGVRWGNPWTITNTSLLSIVSRDSGQNVTETANAGTQYRLPLFARPRSRLTASFGFDFKNFHFTSYNSNNFFFTTTTTNSQGAETNQSVTPIGQPVINRYVAYFPISAGLEYSRSDSLGITSAAMGVSLNFTGGDEAFKKLSYSSKAVEEYGKYTLTVSREQRLPSGFSLVAQAGGQAATGPLIYNEQFALGGMNSVRGYYEGDAYGDCGWRGSLEARTPYWRTQFAGLQRSYPTWLRASAFTDFGQRFFLDNLPGFPESVLWSAGFGLLANINNSIDARVTVAWPFSDSTNTRKENPRAYFSLGGQF